MNGGVKTSWKAIRIHPPGSSSELSGAERLAALYRFQNGELAAGHVLADAARGAEVVGPDQIDWTTFPVLAALEAVTTDELFRLRSLILGGPPAERTLPQV